MAGFVICNHVFFVFRKNGVLFLSACDNDVNRLSKVFRGNATTSHTNGTQGCFVDNVCKVSTGGAGCGFCYKREIHAGLHLDIVCMHLKDILTTGKVRKLHGNAPVKAAGAKQCLIQRLGTVGCGQNNNALVVVKAVHFREELVERLFTLIVGIQGGIAALTDGVDLIDKDDARCFFVCLFEEVANLCGATTNKHLNKLGTCNLEEGNPRFTGNGFGNERFAGTRRAYQKRTAR